MTHHCADCGDEIGCGSSRSAACDYFPARLGLKWDTLLFLNVELCGDCRHKRAWAVMRPLIEKSDDPTLKSMARALKMLDPYIIDNKVRVSVSQHSSSANPELLVYNYNYRTNFHIECAPSGFRIYAWKMVPVKERHSVADLRRAFGGSDDEYDGEEDRALGAMEC